MSDRSTHSGFADSSETHQSERLTDRVRHKWVSMHIELPLISLRTRAKNKVLFVRIFAPTKVETVATWSKCEEARRDFATFASPTMNFSIASPNYPRESTGPECSLVRHFLVTILLIESGHPSTKFAHFPSIMRLNFRQITFTRDIDYSSSFFLCLLSSKISLSSEATRVMLV